MGRSVPNKKPLLMQRWMGRSLGDRFGEPATAYLASRVSSVVPSWDGDSATRFAGFGTKHGPRKVANRRLPGFKGPYPSTALDKRVGYSIMRKMVLR